MTIIPSDGGEARKLRGMQQAVDALRKDYKARAFSAIEELANRGVKFTSDDVIDMVGLPNQSGPNKNNGVGGLISGAAKRGIIVFTGEHTKSRRRLSHARDIRVWIGSQARG